MSNEIKADWNTGETLYARVYNGTRQVWNTDTSTFEDWEDGNVGDYDIVLTEDSGLYIGDFPACDAGRYYIVGYLQSGGSPAVADATVHDGEEIVWDGSAIVVGMDFEGYANWIKVEGGLITDSDWRILNA